MGLDASTIGVSTVESAVTARLTALGIDDRHAYWMLVHTSSTELQALIEAVVVPETWFFRNREAFSALTRHVVDVWLPGRRDAMLRLLSLPCSSGEEPYSMCMALHDAGFPLEQCRIDAIDISAQVLVRARQGVYRKNSFRGDDLEFRDRYFDCTGEGYRINDIMREPVCFQQGNLLDDGFLPGMAIYDAIFCRNLLIYFDRETQDRAFRVLQRLLKPGGLLFVGPSEGALPLRHHLESMRVPHSFAFHGRCQAAPTQPARQPRMQHGAMPVPVGPVAQPVAAPVVAARGELSAAIMLCEKSLAEDGPSARGFHLLGLIASARGDVPTAIGCYRKALYLDRDHCETLAHLGVLLENAGEVAEANNLYARLHRLQAGSRVA
jgi:chemotaxis protein methyltransferase WspC